MKVRSREGLLSLGFILMSLGSLSYISAAAVNYTQFFPALSGLEPDVTEVVLSRNDGSSRSILSAHVLVANPTDYAGLRVATVRVKLFFLHSLQTERSLFKDQPLIVLRNVNALLGARSELAWVLVFSLSQEETSSLEAFLEAFPGQITAHTITTVEVSTFLTPVTGRTILDKIEDMPLS